MTSSADSRSVTDVLEFAEGLAPGISDSTVILETETLDSLFSALSSCRMVVASRLHGVILSHLFGLPVLAITYDDKVNIHMENMQQANCLVDINSVTSDTLISTYEAMASDFENIRQEIVRQRNERSQRLDAHFDHIVSGRD